LINELKNLINPYPQAIQNNLILKDLTRFR
jgi:hypothetical protein